MRRLRLLGRLAPHLVEGIAATAAFVTLAAVSASPAHANGVPVPVALSYIDLSNWGPTDATGKAELIFAEGIVRISADGLPRLTGEVYQGWLVNSEVGDAISLGRFNADAVGHVSYEGTLPPLSDFGFDLLMITVEPEPDEAPQPSEQRSIGGYFSLLGQASVDGSGVGTTGTGLQAPGQLPNTGDPGFIVDMVRIAALTAAMALSVFVGVRLSRRHA